MTFLYSGSREFLRKYWYQSNKSITIGVKGLSCPKLRDVNHGGTKLRFCGPPKFFASPKVNRHFILYEKKILFISSFWAQKWVKKLCADRDTFYALNSSREYKRLATLLQTFSLVHCLKQYLCLNADKFLVKVLYELP